MRGVRSVVKVLKVSWGTTHSSPSEPRSARCLRVAQDSSGRVSRVLAKAAACLLLVSLAACENDPAAVAAMFPDVRPDAEVIRDFETIYSDSAQIKVRVTGPQMLRVQEESQFVQYFPAGAHLEFYDDAGKISSTLESGYGIRYETDDRVLLRDSVVWQSVAGDRLDTEELHWVSYDRKIYSDRFVRLRQSDKEITGVGFESNEDFSRAKVIAIQGIVQVEPGTTSPRDTSARLPSRPDGE